MKKEDHCIRCGKNFALFGAKRSNSMMGGDMNICQACFSSEHLSGQHEATTDRSVSGLTSNTIQRSTSSMRTINLPISTTNEIPLQKIVKYVGLVRGGTVRAKNVGSDFLAGVKNVVGGEIKGYTSLLAEAREEAIHRMEEDAVRIGANGIIGMTFSTSMIDVGAAEVYAFGTGILLDSEETEEQM